MYKNIILSLVLLMSVNVSWALVSADIVEKHIKEQRLDVAEKELQEVLDANPDSNQANCYMAQIKKFNKQDATLYENKCGNFIQKVSAYEDEVRVKQATNLFTGFMIFVTIGILGYLASGWYKKYKEHQAQESHENEVAVQKEDKRTKLLKELMFAKETLSNSRLLIETSVKQKLRKNKLFDEYNKLDSMIIDAIEIVHKKGDYDTESVSMFLNDVIEFNQKLNDELERNNEKAS